MATEKSAIPTLGPRPQNPAVISFARSCFVQDGTEVQYRVDRGLGHSGPAVFSDEAQASAYAKRLGRKVFRSELPAYRRIRWTEEG